MAMVLPRKPVERIQFCENHTTPWSTNATSIGTTTAAVTDLLAKTVAARAAFNNQQAALQAAKAATADFHAAVRVMSDAASDILKQVKAKAATAGEGVYSLAEIPAPAIPSAKPPPGKPTGFAVALDETGALTLTWKCPNPPGTSGTMYRVCRRVGPAGEFAYIGGSGAKTFVDDTLPAGSPSVTYQVQAVRSTAAGPWAQFTVNFGVSNGVTTASVVETAPGKIAA